MLIKVRIALMEWAGPGSSRVPAVLAASAALLHPAPRVRASHLGGFTGAGLTAAGEETRPLWPESV